ncbi:MAG: aminopeptidase P family protein [Candidatus Kapaibacterium sp.]
MKKYVWLIILFAALNAGFAQNIEYTYPWPDGIPKEIYEQRRQRLAGYLGENSALIALAGDYFSGCVERDDFRQNANMVYLSGCPEPESILIIMPKGFTVGGTDADDALFLAGQDPDDIFIHGMRMQPEDAREILGISAFMKSELLNNLKIFAGIDTLYFPIPGEGGLHSYSTGNESMPKLINKISEEYPFIKIRKNLPALNRLRGVKDSAEIRLLRRAAEITAAGHIAAMKAIAPGMSERQIEAEMEYQFRALGGDGPAFPSIIGSGPNSCIVHYTKSARVARSGELVLMDCGADYCTYSGDISRTVPVDGKFTQEQRFIYEIVLEAHREAAKKAKPGAMFMAPHIRAMSVIAQGLTEIGVTRDPADYREYFSHGTSHYLGIDVHDTGSFGSLEPGNVITIEPGIYIPPGSDCDPKWWGIGVRIEDDYLITQDGSVSLTPDLPMDPDEIEKIMSE